MRLAHPDAPQPFPQVEPSSAVPAITEAPAHRSSPPSVSLVSNPGWQPGNPIRPGAKRPCSSQGGGRTEEHRDRLLADPSAQTQAEAGDELADWKHGNPEPGAKRQRHQISNLQGNERARAGHGAARDDPLGLPFSAGGLEALAAGAGAGAEAAAAATATGVRLGACTEAAEAAAAASEARLWDTVGAVCCNASGAVQLTTRSPVLTGCSLPLISCTCYKMAGGTASSAGRQYKIWTYYQ